MKLSAELDRKLELLISQWNARVGDAPALLLDQSWPSVGVIDLISLPLIGKSRLDSNERELLSMISLYVAGVIDYAWNSFGVNCTCQLKDGRIELVGFKNGEKASHLELEKELETLLAAPPTSLKILNEQARHIAPAQGWIGPFTIGCALGLSPSVHGKWESETEQSFKENINKVINAFALTCVRSYERTFPDELLGQVGEIYLSGGIFPPLCLGEAFPAERGATQLYTVFSELNASDARILACAENFASMPDEHISVIGLILGCALSNYPASDKLVAAGERFGRFNSLLRAAVVKVRSQAKKASADWLLSGSFNPEEKSRYLLERQLGFLPWFNMTPEFVQKNWVEKRFRRICEALSYFDYDTAADLSDVLIFEDPKLFELRLQRAFLFTVNRQYEEAEIQLRMLISEPECEGEAKLYALWAFNDLRLGRVEESKRRLGVAYSAASITHPDRAAIVNDYAWMLIETGEAEKALTLLDEAERLGGPKLTINLNRAQAYKVLGNEKEREKILSLCRKISPLDKRVFIASFI